MEQNKDQSGAVIAWMRPDEIDGLLAAAQSESATRQYGRVYAKQYDPDMVPVCGAAVRGEAVALTDADIVEIARVAHADGRLSWIGFDKDDIGEHTAPILSKCHFQLVRAVLAKVSARAADAPSEPSERGYPVYLAWNDQINAWVDVGLAEYLAADVQDRRVAYEPQGAAA